MNFCYIYYIIVVIEKKIMVFIEVVTFESQSHVYL